MIEKVDTIEIGEPVRKINNVLRGFVSIPAAFGSAAVHGREHNVAAS